MNSSNATVATLLAWARAQRAGSAARLESEVLLAHLAEVPRSTIMAFPERVVASGVARAFESAWQRCCDAEPLAYVLGAKEFYGLALEVTPAVLVPRPETELLVDETLARLPAGRDLRVLDAGTGSGAVALALKHARASLDVTGIDASSAALGIARTNGRRLKLDVRWLESNWLAALGQERFAAIVSNPPYVASGDPHFAALRYEPRLALDGGPDGLGPIAVLLEQTRHHLEAGGQLLLEHGYDQRDGVAKLADKYAWTVVAVCRDLCAQPRVTVLQVS